MRINLCGEMNSTRKYYLLLEMDDRYARFNEVACTTDRLFADEWIMNLRHKRTWQELLV